MHDDEAEYRQYVAARLAQLRRTAYLICGDWHLAEDVVSTVLAKLYLAWRRASAAGNLDAYVRTMLVRAVVDERRRPWRRERPSDFGVPDRAGVDPTAAADDRMVLSIALRQMPRRRRAVLVLRFYDGLSVEETAEAMGCSAGTVKSQTARGLAALRDLLPADYLALHGGAR